MKKLNSTLRNQLNEHVTTLANCWLIKFTNGNNLGFTDYTEPLDIDNIIFYNNSGITGSSIEHDNSLATDNFEINGFLDSLLITREELLDGTYDGAYIEFFVLDYLKPETGKIILKSGYIREIRLSDNKFYVDIRGITYKLSTNTTKTYSATCRTKFCSNECNANTENYKLFAIVKNITNKQHLQADNINIKNHIYTNSQIHFLFDKDKIIEQIKIAYDNNIILIKDINDEVRIGTKFLLLPECDKKFSTCVGIYDNALNFRGEPHVPGVDEINKTAGTFK